MFTLVKHAPVPAFGLDFFEYRHVQTGARHLHLQLPGELHAFDLSFRTIPTDESGVAHILEHCVLEGSRRFPVPGIFHKRSASSFSTFSNAMTGRDQTRFVFHTPLEKDFDQLLAMYMDACFFPLLAEETFAQEGHRLEFAGPAGPLTLTGVVFNEMKANYANLIGRALNALLAGLFPGTVYALDSGGNPAAIPSLTHQDFLAFHRRYYCAANASFFYCGPMAPDRLHERLEEFALGRLSAAPGERAPRPLPGPPFAAPREAELRFPYSGAAAARQGLGLLAWTVGDSRDLREDLLLHTLKYWLFGSSEAPLLRLILQSGMGAPAVGLLPAGSELAMLLGAQGMDLAAIDGHLASIQAELERLAREPADPAILRAIVDLQLLDLRRTEDENPATGVFPMRLIERLREADRLEADPLERLNPAAVLEGLRGPLTDEKRMRGELRARLLENPRRLRLKVLPDDRLGAAEAGAERARLAAIEAQLDDAGRARLVEAGRRLKAHREDHSRDGSIPLLHLADVDRELTRDTLRPTPIPGLSLTIAGQPTNGLAYLELEAELASHSVEAADAAQWLGYLTAFGYGDLNPEQADLRRRSLGAQLHITSHLEATSGDPDRPLTWVSLRGYCTAERADEYAAMMRQTLSDPRLDDEPRWRHLLESQLTAWRQSAGGHLVQIHLLKALAARQTTVGWLVNEVDGFPGIGRMRATLKENGLAALLDRVRNQQRQAAAAPRRALAVAEETALTGLAPLLQREWAAPGASAVPDAPDARPGGEPLLWLTDTTVSYVGLSWRGLPRLHTDWPLLRVAASLIQSKYLHLRIREKGGAYGYSAACQNGSFLLSTYRDPRLSASLEDLRGALDWLQRSDIPPRHVEEAALFCLKALLMAQSPVARIRARRERERLGLDDAHLQETIDRIRRVTLDELRDAARRHLDPATERIVVVSSRELARREGLAGYREEEI